MGAALKTAAGLAETLLERRTPAVTRRLSRTERTTELAAAGLFLVIAAVMGATADPEPAGTAALLVLSYALVRRVRFQLGTGLIRPTQVVFVPMLFLTPAAAVPLLVTLGAVLGELPDLLRKRAHPERLAVVVADGWYAIGPALVVVAIGEPTLAVLALALLAQFAGDYAASAAREWFGSRISPAELLPVLALVYVIDATLAPIGYLAARVSEVQEYAYLLAIAPAALLGLIARERGERIEHELELERAFRRSTRALDARAEDLRRQAGRLQRGDEPEDRARLEGILLATTVEALHADAGRLSDIAEDGRLQPRLAIGEVGPALELAELALGAAQANALAIGVGHSHVLAVMREGSPFSAVERDLLEHLAAQAAVTLENLRLEELMRRKEAELRAILEGVADAIAAEGPDGRLVFANGAATRLLNGAANLGEALGVAPTLLPGSHVFEGEEPEPLVIKRSHRWSRVKASPVLEGAHPRLAISVIEDITEIKQAEESQRFLSEASRVLASSLQLDRTLPEVTRLAAAHFGGACVIELDGAQRFRAGIGMPSVLFPLHEGRMLLGGAVDHATGGELALRVGNAVENARLYRQREAIAHTLQRSLLPPELPVIPGLDTAALYRPAGEINEVGGDFYDLFPLGRNEWFAVIGDVCGKGAEAAAVTALVRYTIRAAVTRHRSPANVLRWLNDAMLRQQADRFVTLACARIELDDAVMVTVACGGHPAPRVLRATGLVQELGALGTVVGLLKTTEAADRTTRLAPGDALVLYTDGLTEARAPHVMTPAQLDTAVAGARRLDARGIVEHLSAQAPDPLRDDLALLAIRVQP
ncbi:SpoIIE family protein phosphatase [Solirubrobacter phytolaccae]|uniref:SpoIIE family protein phosphatase n=1 Tax=Solirubrobacter phytolaccae TaxID=1404360 RepID=A0A9X3N730_9ACTN|nr:SpoIIE family protein phosphatase [Solirubrobacter phytolaccae]MDA0179497.1 SpoIIE family protein phosphatase [Solirubrobacter phytolaccae]